MGKKYQQENIDSIWDNVAGSYNYKIYWKGLENQANLHHLLLHIGNPKGKRIIEMGCGSGFTSLVLAQKGANLAILDISQKSLEIASSTFVEFKLSKPEVYKKDAINSKLPSNSFDIVWNGGVIEHFLDDGKKELIREMYRITKSRGKIIILVPNAWCLPFQLAQFWQKITKKWPYGFEDDISPRKLKKLCKSLNIEKFKTYAFNPILGWRWIPKINKLIKVLNYENIKNHSRKSRIGFISILIIEKNKA
jgi:ubiquinone/menaquinone biosynthesis C-methylase UbiE